MTKETPTNKAKELIVNQLHQLELRIGDERALEGYKPSEVKAIEKMINKQVIRLINIMEKHKY